jgi:hypothetical protein
MNAYLKIEDDILIYEQHLWESFYKQYNSTMKLQIQYIKKVFSQKVTV